MSHYSGNMDDFAVDSRSLAGPLEAKLKAVQLAGFSRIMLSANDLVGNPDGMDAALAAVAASGLRVSGFQALRDFEGLSGRAHDYKVDIAKSTLAMCHALGCHLLLIRSTTLEIASTENRTVAKDLRKLAMLAIPMNIRIAYEASGNARCVKEFPQAWDIVCEADMPNLGLSLGFESFSMFTSAISMDELDMLDPDKVFLVQLADFMWSEGYPVKPSAAVNRFRVFPGEGSHSEALAAFVTKVHSLGFRGTYSLEVFNDDYQQLPVPVVLERARRSALWLGEGVLQRSVPLPNDIRLKRADVR
jgi:sugar phosphate isomerase/epimerase